MKRSEKLLLVARTPPIAWQFGTRHAIMKFSCQAFSYTSMEGCRSLVLFGSDTTTPCWKEMRWPYLELLLGRCSHRSGSCLGPRSCREDWHRRSQYKVCPASPLVPSRNKLFQRVKKEGQNFTLLVASADRKAPETHLLNDLEGFKGKELNLKVEYGDFSANLAKVVDELEKVGSFSC